MDVLRRLHWSICTSRRNDWVEGFGLGCFENRSRGVCSGHRMLVAGCSLKVQKHVFEISSRPHNVKLAGSVREGGLRNGLDFTREELLDHMWVNMRLIDRVVGRCTGHRYSLDSLSRAKCPRPYQTRPCGSCPCRHASSCGPLTRAARPHGQRGLKCKSTRLKTAPS